MIFPLIWIKALIRHQAFAKPNYQHAHGSPSERWGPKCSSQRLEMLLHSWDRILTQKSCPWWPFADGPMSNSWYPHTAATSKQKGRAFLVAQSWKTTSQRTDISTVTQTNFSPGCACLFNLLSLQHQSDLLHFLARPLQASKYSKTLESSFSNRTTSGLHSNVLRLWNWLWASHTFEPPLCETRRRR